MNIENLVSILENKEPLDAKVISQILLLIEKYPYFQTAHMILLKTMQKTSPEKYNTQLKISGSFISDKRKLFEFINSDLPVVPDTPVAKKEIVDTKKETADVKKEQDTVQEKPVTRQEKLKVKPTEKQTVAKEEAKKIIKEEIAKLHEEAKKEVQKKEPSIKKKVDLPEGEIEKKADENSKVKHNEIIKDFFHGHEKGKVEKTVVEPTEQKKESTKTPEIKKEEIEPPPIKEKKVIKEVNVAETDKQKIKTPIVEKKSVPIAEKKEETPTKKEVIEKKTETPLKKEVVEKTEEDKKPVKESQDAMSNIFSKIRQIKKEMNIASETPPETIEVNKDEDEKKNLLKKTTTTSTEKEKKTPKGRVIKESFIGFNEENEEIQPKKEDKEEVLEKKEEQSEIKESELTAKDLFKQHKQKKEKTGFAESEEVTKKEEIPPVGKSKISELVEMVNDKTSLTTNKNVDEVIEKKEPIVKKTEPPVTEKKEVTTSTSGNESAADALLRRIAEKKKRIREEQALEEKRKQEEQQKEMEAVDAIIKGEKVVKYEVEEVTEPEVKKEEQEKEIVEEETTKTEITEKSPKGKNLIDSFIEKAESLERIGSKESSLKGDISESSTTESEDIMTETYADLLIQQKKYEKAIGVYEKLILKFPEKKTYFAIQIKKVESLIK